MKKVNLKEFYYYVKNDLEVEVDDEVYSVLEKYKKQEHAYREKLRRNKSYYSLDRQDGIENSALRQVQSPEELFFLKELELRMYRAIKTLPRKQAERIILFFYYGMKVNEIARMQGVVPSTVSESIMTGLEKLKNFEF